MITPELKKLRNRLKEVSREYGSFSVDLQITVYGQSVCFNCIATSNINSDLVYTVAGTEETIVQNLKDALKNHDTDRLKRRALDHMFPDVMKHLDEITGLK